MKKRLFALASLLFLVVLSMPTTLKADVMNPGPSCGPSGCTKP